jgi:fluoride ion exporter CrcB/FEX
LIISPKGQAGEVFIQTKKLILIDVKAGVHVMVNKIICWIVIITFLVNILGCYSMKEFPKDELKESKSMITILIVTTKDNRVITLNNVFIQHPKLTGNILLESGELGGFIELSFDNIDKVEMERLDSKKTIKAGFYILVSAVAGFAIFMLILSWGLPST